MPGFTCALADKLRTSVLNGATAQIRFADGLEIGPSPIVAIKVDEQRVAFTWLGDDRDHVVELERLEDDDSDVLVRCNNGDVLRVSPLLGIFVWESQLQADLADFVRAWNAGSLPGLDFTAFDVRYRGLIRK